MHSSAIPYRAAVAVKAGTMKCEVALLRMPSRNAVSDRSASGRPRTASTAFASRASLFSSSPNDARARTSRPTSPAASRSARQRLAKSSGGRGSHCSSVYSDSLMRCRPLSHDPRSLLVLRERNEIADVFQTAHLHRRELYAECLLHRQNQPYVRKAVPTVDVVGRQLGLEHQVIVVKDLAKYGGQTSEDWIFHTFLR